MEGDSEVKEREEMSRTSRVACRRAAAGRPVAWAWILGAALCGAGCGADGPPAEQVAATAATAPLEELSPEDCEERPGGDGTGEAMAVPLRNWVLRYGLVCQRTADVVDRCNALVGAGVEDKMACVDENMAAMPEACPEAGREALAEALREFRVAAYCESNLRAAMAAAVAAALDVQGERLGAAARDGIARRCTERARTVGAAVACAGREGTAAVERAETVAAAKAAVAEHSEALAAAGALESTEERCTGGGSAAAARACVARLAGLHAAAWRAVAAVPAGERAGILAGCLRAGRFADGERGIADALCAAEDAAAREAVAELAGEVDLDECGGRRSARWSDVLDCARHGWLTRERVAAETERAAAAAAAGRHPDYAAGQAARHCAWKVGWSVPRVVGRLRASEHPREGLGRQTAECVDREMGAYEGLVRAAGERYAAEAARCVKRLREGRQGWTAAAGCVRRAAWTGGDRAFAEALDRCKYGSDATAMAACEASGDD